MTFRIKGSHLALAAILAVPPMLVGCGDDSDKPAAQDAAKAVGVDPDKEPKETVTSKREVLVKEEKEVVDKATGEVISKSEKVTPVTIVEKKTEKTDVNVNVGESQTTEKGKSPLPADAK